MNMFLVFVSLFLWSFNVFCEPSSEKAEPVPMPEEAVCEKNIFVNVNGLVCDFCARSLEKVFGKHKDVESIHVDLDKSQIFVQQKTGRKISDQVLEKLITDSGYNLVSIERECKDG